MPLSADRKTISLFTGAGGLDVGLEQAGFSTTVAVEIDKWARTTLAQNRWAFGDRQFPILADITSYSPDELLAVANLEPGEAFLVAGGPPCQSFSTAGKRGSIGDPRGSLFANFASVVSAARPRFFVMENVRGMLSAPITHRPHRFRGSGSPPLGAEEEAGSAFRVILGVLEAGLGYQVTYGLVDAADYGVPQHRLRVLVIGSRDHELPSSDLAALMPPTHPQGWVGLKEGLSMVPPTEPEFIPYSKERAAVLRNVPQGCNWRWLRDNPEFGAEYARKLMGGAWESGGGKVGFFRRLAWDKPSPTLPTSPIQKGTCLCHPEETRPLSVQEYAAIQQFPSAYTFAGPTAQKYKQIGNAVPTGLGRALGECINSLVARDNTNGQLRLFDSVPTWELVTGIPAR